MIGIPATLGALVSVAVFLPSKACAAAAEAAALDEVVVTARKIEENVQHVPMSVQVLSADFLADADVSSMYDLQFSIPGLVINNIGLFGAGFSLRGVSEQSGTGRGVAAHINGVYLGDRRLPIARMFDVERIEVLKGPQGTLYGRNATGGSINFITRPPETTSTASVEVAHGSFSTARAEGHVNLPLQDAAVRLAFIGSDGDGYIRNSVDDRKFAENDYWGLRASTRVDVGGARIDFMAQHTEDDGATGELWTPNLDSLPNPRDIRLTTVTLEDPHLELENSVVSVGLAFDLDFANLQSISGYARNEMRNLDDCAGQPPPLGCVRGGHDSYAQWSQEVRLEFEGTGRTNGLIGLYYYEDESDGTFHQAVPPFPPPFDSRNAGGETVRALFGQATLRLAESWSLTGGVRLSREKQHFTTIGSGTEDSQTLLVGRHKSTNDSWRLDVTYAPADDLRLYAGVSTGYRSAVVQFSEGEPDDVAPENLIAYETGVKSQWMDRRLTVNAAAFFYDYDDMQLSTISLAGAATVTHIDNAAKARLYGIDAQTTLQVTERLALSGSVVWMPEREFIEYVNDETGDTLSGNKLERAPEISATAAIEYWHPLSAYGRMSARLEYFYRSGYYYTEENEPWYFQSGFGLLNARLQFEAAGGRWYAFASGRNLTNEDYFYQVFIQTTPGRPRTYEVGAGYRF